MKGRDRGFAIAIVLLFSLITMGIVTITLSMTTMGTRKQVADNSRSEQAFLAADTGISTFVSRVKEGEFSKTVFEIACWVQGTPVAGSSSCEPGATANLGRLLVDPSNAQGPFVDVKVVAINPAQSTVTVQAVGRDSNASAAAKATVTQNMVVLKPPFLNVSPPAGLTSCPSITGGGNSKMYGSATEFNGVVPDITTVTAASPTLVSATMAGSVSGAGWPAELTVGEANLLDSGSFIRLNNQTYKVVNKTAVNKVTVVPASSTSLPPTGTLLTGSLGLIPIAARAAPSDTLTTSSVAETVGKKVYRFPVSDPTSVFIGDVLYIDYNGTTYGVTVDSKGSDNGFAGGDLNLGYVNVTLGATGAGLNRYKSNGTLDTGTVPPPSESQFLGTAVGTAVRRYVPAAMSASSIGSTTTGVVPASQWGGSSTVTPAAIAGSSTVKCGDQLFAQVFNGLNRSTYYNLTPPANRWNAIMGPLAKSVYWMGPKPTSPSTPSGASFNLGSNELCGSGVIVIHGDLTLNGTGNQKGNVCAQSGDGVNPTGFNGVLYVTGNFTSKGNSVVKGAVIVEGNVSLPQSTSLVGGMNITYDQGAVLRSSKNLSPVSFFLRSGSWNQE